MVVFPPCKHLLYKINQLTFFYWKISTLEFDPNTMASTTGNTPPSHTEALSKLCRFCCELLPKEQKNIFKVAGYQNMLKIALMETDADKSDNNPAYFCLRCYASVKNIIEGQPQQPIWTSLLGWPTQNRAALAVTFRN